MFKADQNGKCSPVCPECRVGPGGHPFCKELLKSVEVGTVCVPHLAAVVSWLQGCVKGQIGVPPGECRTPFDIDAEEAALLSLIKDCGGSDLDKRLAAVEKLRQQVKRLFDARRKMSGGGPGVERGCWTCANHADEDRVSEVCRPCLFDGALCNWKPRVDSPPAPPAPAVMTEGQVRHIQQHHGKIVLRCIDENNASSPFLSDLCASHEALRSQLEEAEKRAALAELLLREAKDAEKNYCADCKSVDLANEDAARAYRERDEARKERDANKQAWSNAASERDNMYTEVIQARQYADSLRSDLSRVRETLRAVLAATTNRSRKWPAPGVVSLGLILEQEDADLFKRAVAELPEAARAAKEESRR